MNFTEALRAMEIGHAVQRPKGLAVKLQPRTVPILTKGLLDSTGILEAINNNWLMCKFPVYVELPNGLLAGEVPCAFTDDDIAATDWEVLP